MRKALNNPWVVGCLCLLAIGAVYWRVVSPSTDVLPESKPTVTVEGSAPTILPTPPMVSSSSLPESHNPKPGAPVISGHWPKFIPRDPFQLASLPVNFPGVNEKFDAPEETEENPTPFLLHAISIEGPRRFAVINRTVVTEGDQVDEVRILHIHPHAVVIESPNGVQRIEFADQRNENVSADDT